MAFTPVATVKEIPPGQAKQITLGSRTLALFNVAGTYYAIDDTCPHLGASLCEGTVEKQEVTCPWHGARFSLDSGAYLCPPARTNVSAYKVQVVGDEIQVDVP